MKPWQGQVSQQAKTGSWQRINNSQSDDLLKKDVFLLRLDHGNNVNEGQYQYTLLPGKTVEQTDIYAKAPEVKVLKNTDSIQAVYHKRLNIAGVAFYDAGTIKLPSGLSISVDKSAIVLLEEQKDQVIISVSVPDVLAQNIEISLAHANQKVIKTTFEMPTDIDMLGVSVTKSIIMK
jgi:hypothetical protein